MKISDALNSATIEKLTEVREKCDDNEQILTPEQEMTYHKAAKKVLRTFEKEFIRFKTSKDGYICGLVCLDISYKFRVIFPGNCIVYSKHKRYELSHFIAIMRPRWLKKNSNQFNNKTKKKDETN